VCDFGQVEWCGVDVYNRLLQVNTLGTIRVTQAFLPLLRKKRGSRVVIVASVAGIGINLNLELPFNPGKNLNFLHIRTVHSAWIHRVQRFQTRRRLLCRWTQEGDGPLESLCAHDSANSLRVSVF